MVVEKASGSDSPLRQGAGKAMVVACSMFQQKAIRPLGFSRRGEYIGGREASGGGPAGLTPWWRGPGAGRATLW
jgi:hypothetical protein